jgi:hypothetical protein
LATPAKDLHVMDAVLISGTLRTVKNGSLMGMGRYARVGVLPSRSFSGRQLVS